MIEDKELINVYGARVHNVAKLSRYKSLSGCQM